MSNGADKVLQRRANVNKSSLFPELRTGKKVVDAQRRKTGALTQFCSFFSSGAKEREKLFCCIRKEVRVNRR
jgi:hypothetical protein